MPYAILDATPLPIGTHRWTLVQRFCFWENTYRANEIIMKQTGPFCFATVSRYAIGPRSNGAQEAL